MSQDPYVTTAMYPRKTGETDDTGSLQRTFAAAARDPDWAQNGVCAWLTGPYTISSPLSIPAGVRVVGQGPVITSITATAGFHGGTSNAMLVVQSGVTVEGIKVDATPASGVVTEGLSMSTGVSGVRVRNCVVMGAKGAYARQIYINGCNDVVVSDCEVSNGTQGIAVMEACVDVRIFDCNVHDITEAAIFVSAALNASVRTVVNGCRIWNIAGGVDNYPLYFATAMGDDSPSTPTCYHLDSRVIGNHVEGTYGKSANKPMKYPGDPDGWPDDPHAGGTADNIGIYQCRGGVIAHNHTYFGGDLGLSVFWCDRCIVTGNVCGVNDTDGIGVYNSTDCIVSGNLSFNNGRDWDDFYRGPRNGSRHDFSGILINSTDVLVAGNRCWEDGCDYPPAGAGTPPANAGSQQFGVLVRDGATGPMVAENHLDGNFQGPLDASQVPLFNVPAMGPQPVVTGTSTDPVVTSLLTALQSLGLITVADA